MNIALIIIYILNGLGLLACAHYHGKEHKSSYNFWVKLISVVIDLGLIWWALGWKFI